MTSDKRDFANFTEFPGVVDKGTGFYKFPTLWYVDVKDRLRSWQIYIRMIKDSAPRQKTIDWALLSEVQVPIKKKYFNYGDNYADIPKGSIVEVWVETGIDGGKITRNIPTYFTEIALEGRANQRNPLHQALIYARGLYLKRVDKGNTINKTGKKVSRATNVMYYPMLAITYKDGEKHLKYPLFLQPKLDGVRCLVYLRKKDGGVDNVIIYSRQLKEIPDKKYIQLSLYSVLNDLYDVDEEQSVYLDGELYKHGKSLQEISGKSRSSAKSRIKKRKDDGANTNTTLDELLEYHVYDCFYPKELDNTYEGRKEQVEELFKFISKKKLNGYDFSPWDVIKPVPTWEVHNKKETNAKFEELVKKGYEGAILRNKTGPYLASPNKTGSLLRSKNLVKMKKRFSSEFEIVDFTQGTRGKDIGAVIWVAQTPTGKKFNLTPKDTTYEERKKVYKECIKNFDKKYKNRMMTTEYEDLSKDGVPLRAKAVSFRDYE